MLHNGRGPQMSDFGTLWDRMKINESEKYCCEDKGGEVRDIYQLMETGLFWDSKIKVCLNEKRRW